MDRQPAEENMDRHTFAPRRRPIIRIAIAGVLIPSVLIITAARGCHYHRSTYHPTYHAPSRSTTSTTTTTR